MRAAGKSVVGNQRKNNEDFIFVSGKIILLKMSTLLLMEWVVILQ